MRARRLQSSLIDRILFDDEAETLTVFFKRSGKYIYHGVPRAIYDAFGKAASAGQFFNEKVRGHFECRPDPVRRRYPWTEGTPDAAPRWTAMPDNTAALATVVSSRAIRAGHEKSFDAWAERICACASRAAGHINTVRLGQTQGLQHLLFQFTGQPEAERWKGSEEFGLLTAEADELSTGLDQVKAGNGVRFELPSEASAAKWKRFVTTWIAVFPVLLTISSLVRLVLKDMPQVVQLIPSSLLLTASLQWIILPRLQRWSRAWVLSNASGDLRKV